MQKNKRRASDIFVKRTAFSVYGDDESISERVKV